MLWTPVLAVLSLANLALSAPEPYRPFRLPDHVDLQDRAAVIAAGGVESAVLFDRAALSKVGEEHLRAARFDESWGVGQVEMGKKRHLAKKKRGQIRRVVRRAPAHCGIGTGAGTASTALPTGTNSLTGGLGGITVTAQPVTGGANSVSIPTRPVTQPATSPITEAVTSPVTQPVTSPITQAVTSPVTQPVTQPTTTTTSTTTTPTTQTKQATTTTSTATTTSTSPSPLPTTALYATDPTGTNGPFSGWGTWFDVGLGACGWYNNPGDPIVAVSAQLFDNWPNYNGWNPNNNPICGLRMNITWGGKWTLAEVADRCPGCAPRSLDMSKGLFEHFATLDVGLLGMDSYTGNITWSWVSGTGSLPALPFTP